MEEHLNALQGEINTLQMEERTRLAYYKEGMELLEELERQIVDLDERGFDRHTPERKAVWKEHEDVYSIIKQMIDDIMITRGEIADAREEQRALLREKGLRTMEGGSFIPSRGNTKLNHKIPIMP